MALLVVDGSGAADKPTPTGPAGRLGERAFQIVSVDEMGEMRTWTGVFLAQPQAAGSLDDLGTSSRPRMATGGRKCVSELVEG